MSYSSPDNMITNSKTRLNYKAGFTECPLNCRCLFCRRGKKGYYSPEKVKERENGKTDSST